MNHESMNQWGRYIMVGFSVSNKEEPEWILCSHLEFREKICVCVCVFTGITIPLELVDMSLKMEL